MQLEQLKSQLKMQEAKQKMEDDREQEIIKFTSILKVKVADKILSKEGSNIEDLPDWVMSGIGIVDKSNEMLMGEDMQDQIEEAQAKQQAQQQQAQQAQQQQMQAAQQGQGQPQGQEQPQEQQLQQGQQTEQM
jgi:membrane protease subunit (stomatin/prohibitin family)